MKPALVVLAALIGVIGRLVVAAMSAAVEGMHVLLFNIEIGERLSSQFAIDPLRALLGVRAWGGLLLGVAFLVLAAISAGARNRPDRGQRPAWAAGCRFAAA